MLGLGRLEWKRCIEHWGAKAQRQHAIGSACLILGVAVFRAGTKELARRGEDEAALIIQVELPRHSVHHGRRPTVAKVGAPLSFGARAPYAVGVVEGIDLANEYACRGQIVRRCALLEASVHLIHERGWAQSRGAVWGWARR